MDIYMILFTIKCMYKLIFSQIFSKMYNRKETFTFVSNIPAPMNMKKSVTCVVIQRRLLVGLVQLPSVFSRRLLIWRQLCSVAAGQCRDPSDARLCRLHQISFVTWEQKNIPVMGSANNNIIRILLIVPSAMPFGKLFFC